jgi:hypothetical protein
MNQQKGVMRNLDRYIAYIGYVLLAIAMITLVTKGFHPIYTVAAIMGVLAITVYLALRNKLAIPDSVAITGYANLGLLITAVFILSAVAIYCFRVNQHEKPIAYYVLLAVAVGSLFYIAMSSKNKRQLHIVVVASCVIGLTHTWTETLMFPGLIGIDPWLHMRVVTQEIANSRITLDGIGVYPSLWHFYLKWAMDWTGLEYRMAALVFVGSIQMIGNIVLAFLVGKELFYNKVGAVAALALSFANWNITFGEWIIPSGIGATYAMLTVYLILVSRRCHNSSRWLIPAVGGLAILGALTHTLAIAWVVGSVICFLIFPALLDPNKNAKQKIQTLAKNNIVTMVVVIAVILWLSLTPSGIATVATLINSSPYAAFGTTSTASDIPNPELVRNSLDHSLLGETIINSIGMLAYIGVALIGILMLSRRSQLHITYAILCVAVLAIGFVPTLLGLPFLDDRWRYLAMVLMSVPMALAVVKLASSHKCAIVIVTVLVVVLAFFNTIGWWSNLTQRALSPNQIVRYALTNKEMDGLAIAEKYNPKVLGIDPYYLAFVQSKANWSESTERRSIYLDRNLLSGEFGNCLADVILLRDAVWKEPFAFGSGAIYMLEYDPVERAGKQGYREVWYNGEIHCLVKTAK